MQALLKISKISIRVAKLNNGIATRQFARMNQKRPKKFDEYITERKEQIDKIIENSQTEKIQREDPEDFEDLEKTENIEQINYNQKEYQKQEQEEDPDVSIVESPGKTSEIEEMYKGFDHETKKFIKKELLYQGYDPHPEKLVQRPHKDVVWGLGGQLLRRKTRFFEKGRMPEVDEVIEFLEAEHAKDVVLVDLMEYGRTDLPRFGIVLTGFSSRHIYRIATNLVKSINEVEIPEMVNPLRVDGRRDDDWIMVSFRSIMVHMFTEDSRGDLNLEEKWTSPPEEDDEEETLAKLKKIRNQRKLYQTYKGE